MQLDAIGYTFCICNTDTVYDNLLNSRPRQLMQLTQRYTLIVGVGKHACSNCQKERWGLLCSRV